MNQIAQGAEAILYKAEDSIIKERFAKRYRLPQLDQSLRQFRTRREAKVLQRLEEANFPAPHLRDFSDTRMSITMDFVPGLTLKEALQGGGSHLELARKIGERIGQLHCTNIIHGDLTTSNMLFSEKTKQLTLIDFGLSFFSDKIEDKAVDLFLLDWALESIHFQIYPGVFQAVLEGYQKAYPTAEEVLQRFEAVKNRGRNKNK